MNILALDCSGAAGCVAVVCGQDGGASREWVFQVGRDHDGALYESLEQALRECPRPDRIVVGTGPGSYTGLRVAAALAMGLRASLGVRIVAPPSVCALDVADREYQVIGDARRGAWYHAVIRERRLMDEIVLVPESGITARVASNGFPCFTNGPSSMPHLAAETRVSALRLARMAAETSVEELLPDSVPVAPLYLKPAHITLPNPV